MWKRLALITAILVGLALVAVGVLLWGMMSHPLALYERSGKSALGKAGFERVALGEGDGEIVYWAAGEGPLLVLLHGAGDTAAAWKVVAPELLEGYRVVVPDLPGHGDSAPDSGPLPVSRMLEGVEDLVDEESPSAPAIIVGNSLGGWLAQLHALKRPGRTARIVVVNGGGLFNETPGLTVQPKTLTQARALVEAIRAPSAQRVPDFVLEDIIEHANEGPIARMTMALSDMEENLLDGRLGELSTPTDIVWGESDQLMKLDYARRMAAELPAARLTTLESCGHVPQNECPHRLAGSLRRLLSEDPPRPAAAADPTPEASP